MVFGKWAKGNNGNNDRSQIGDEPPARSIYRGPGLYEQDIEEIKEGFEELKNLLDKPHDTKAVENKLDLLSKAVLKIAENVGVFDKNLKSIEELVAESAGLSSAGKKQQAGSNNELKSIIKEMEDRLKVRFSAIERLMTDTKLAVPGTPSPLPLAPPNNLQNKNKTLSPRKIYSREDFKKRCQELKRFFEPRFEIKEADYHLNTSNYDIVFWKVEDKYQEWDKSAGKKPMVVFGIVYNEDLDRQRERAVLENLREILDKFYMAGDKAENDQVMCIGLTSTVFKLDVRFINEWYSRGIGFFQLESILYLMPIWGEIKNDLVKTFRSRFPMPGIAETGGEPTRAENIPAESADPTPAVIVEVNPAATGDVVADENEIPLEIAAKALGGSDEVKVENQNALNAAHNAKEKTEVESETVKGDDDETDDETASDQDIENDDQSEEGAENFRFEPED